MLKKIALVVVAIGLTASFASFARAADDFAGLDVKAISDASDTVLEASVNVDVDALANKTQTEDAVEACFHRCGWYGHCHNYCYSPCYNYNYCYSPCYYNTCATTYTAYEPVYTVSYRPVTYTTYTTSCYHTCQTSYWGCGCGYGH